MISQIVRSSSIFACIAVTLVFSVVLNAQDSNQEQSDALVRAAYNDDFEIDINAKDLNGYTALMFAGMWGPATLVRFLLEAGADVNVKKKLYGG